MRTRGNVLNGVYEYVKLTAPERLDYMVEGLPGDLRSRLGKLPHAGWFPVEHFGHMTSRAVNADMSQSERTEFFKGMGAHIATAAINSIMRLVLRMLTPTLFARKLPAFWARDNDFGEFKLLEITPEEGRLVAQIVGTQVVPHMAPIGVGFIITVLGALLGKSATGHCPEYDAGEIAPESARLSVSWEP